MRVRIQVVIESDDGQVQDVQDVFQLQRGELKPERLGLTLEEAKGTLEGVPRMLAARQVEEYVDAQRCCPSCGRQRTQKGRHEIVYRTLFGRLRMESPRLYECRCQAHARKSFSPLAELLTDRTAAELAYLEAKWASLIPFQATSELMAEVLPLGQTIATTSIRRMLHQVAERIESQLGDERFVFLPLNAEGDPSLPDPTAPMTVGLDGGYVHSCEQRSRQEGWFEVIVGKSVPVEGAAKRFAFVNTYDTKPKRRLFEVLKSQGLHANQPVTFLSDGGETVRNLQMYLNPLAEHLLDWFHISMRLTVMGQMNKGMRDIEPASLIQTVEKRLESLNHHLWNGNVGPAQTISTS
ncbi:MAG: ISKra4 family transposase [Bryobacteraceae bacterium]